VYDDLSKHVVLLSVMEHAVNKPKKKMTDVGYDICNVISHDKLILVLD
jgi:hypothetical protein